MKIISKYIWIIILFIFFIFSFSYKNIFEKWVISYNDTSYNFNTIDFIKNLSIYSSNNFWENSSLLILLNYNIKTLLIYILSSLNISEFIISYCVTFWFTLLAWIIIYHITYKHSKNFYISFFISFFIIIANNFVVENLRFWWFWFYYPFIILLYVFFDRFIFILKNKEIGKKDILILSIISLLISIPIYFAMYVSMIFLAYLIFRFYKIKKLNTFPLIFIIILLLHSFWIVPFLINTLIWNNAQILMWDNVDYVYNWYKYIANYLNILSWRNYFSSPTLQINPGIIWYIFYLIFLWFIILMVILNFKKASSNKQTIILSIFVFFLIYYTLWIWPNSHLIWNIWTYLWENIWFFNFFRSFTRFYIIALVALTFLFIYLLTTFSKKIQNIVSFVLFIILILTHSFIFSWNILWMIKNIHIPNEYYLLNNIMNNNDRYLSLPKLQYESYFWSNNNQQFWIHDIYFQKNFLNSELVMSLAENSINNHPININFEYSKEFLTYFWIDYILLHKDFIDILALSPWIIHYQQIEEILDKKFLKVIDNKYFSLYKVYNKNNRFEKKLPHLFIYNLNWLSDNNKIIFPYNFDKWWKVYLKNQQWIFTKPLFENTHSLVYDYANWWTISKDEIIKYVDINYSNELKKEGYPKTLDNWQIDYKYYKLNTDWSIDLEITLYFKPQSYFYLWLIISWTTFVILISYLWIDTIRNRRKKNVELLEKNQTV